MKQEPSASHGGIRWLRVTPRRLALAAVAALVLVLAGLAYAAVRRQEGYYAPAYSADRNHVYFLQRTVVAIVWGLGFEFFTPPAYVHIVSDKFSVRRLDIRSGRIEVISDLPDSPLTGEHVREYRGRLFQQVEARIGVTPSGALQHVVSLQVSRVPVSDHFWFGRLWDTSRGTWVAPTAWQKGMAPFSFQEGDVLADDWEVMTVRGADVLPAAILAYHHVTRIVRVLQRNADFDALYPGGVPLATIEQTSRRENLERERTMRETYAGIVARLQREGLSEGDAMLRANKEMQRLGYYPKTPTITARPLSDVALPDALPIFDISEEEFKVGLFQDLERAIAAPGTPVDKEMGEYVVHRDYTTSARLNAFLASGERRFLLRYRGQIYDVTIERP
jgi:hypothetical protein